MKAWCFVFMQIAGTQDGSKDRSSAPQGSLPLSIHTSGHRGEVLLFTVSTTLLDFISLTIILKLHVFSMKATDTLKIEEPSALFLIYLHGA